VGGHGGRRSRRACSRINGRLANSFCWFASHGSTLPSSKRRRPAISAVAGSSPSPRSPFRPGEPAEHIVIGRARARRCAAISVARRRRWWRRRRARSRWCGDPLAQTLEALQKQEGRPLSIRLTSPGLRLLQFQRSPHARSVNSAPEMNVSLKLVRHLELHRWD
jgi:hypothetical protein